VTDNVIAEIFDALGKPDAAANLRHFDRLHGSCEADIAELEQNLAEAIGDTEAVEALRLKAEAALKLAEPVLTAAREYEQATTERSYGWSLRWAQAHEVLVGAVRAHAEAMKETRDPLKGLAGMDVSAK